MSTATPFIKSDFNVQSDAFEGPLDLLLTLVEKRKLFVSDISLSKVTDEYVEYIQSLEEFPVGQGSHFIWIASTLMLVKSRSLLPDLSLSEDEEQDIESLEKRLEVYGLIKEKGVLLGDLYLSERLYFRPALKGIKPVFSPDGSLSVDSLRDSILKLYQKQKAKEVFAIPEAEVKKVIKLKEVLSDLTGRIQRQINLNFSEIINNKENSGSRVNIVVHFIALLELVKQGLVVASQFEEDIRIELLEKK